MIAALLLIQAEASSPSPARAFFENAYVTCLQEAGKYPRINTVPPDAASRSNLASRIIDECAAQRAHVVADWRDHPKKIGRNASDTADNAAFARRALDWITDIYRQTFVSMPQPSAVDQLRQQ